MKCQQRPTQSIAVRTLESNQARAGRAPHPLTGRTAPPRSQPKGALGGGQLFRRPRLGVASQSAHPPSPNITLSSSRAHNLGPDQPTLTRLRSIKLPPSRPHPPSNHPVHPTCAEHWLPRSVCCVPCIPIPKRLGRSRLPRAKLSPDQKSEYLHPPTPRPPPVAIISPQQHGVPADTPYHRALPGLVPGPQCHSRRPCRPTSRRGRSYRCGWQHHRTLESCM